MAHVTKFIFGSHNIEWGFTRQVAKVGCEVGLPRQVGSCGRGVAWVASRLPVGCIGCRQVAHMLPEQVVVGHMGVRFKVGCHQVAGQIAGRLPMFCYTFERIKPRYCSEWMFKLSYHNITMILCHNTLRVEKSSKCQKIF